MSRFTFDCEASIVSVCVVSSPLRNAFLCLTATSTLFLIQIDGGGAPKGEVKIVLKDLGIDNNEVLFRSMEAYFVHEEEKDVLQIALLASRPSSSAVSCDWLFFLAVKEASIICSRWVPLVGSALRLASYSAKKKEKKNAYSFAIGVLSPENHYEILSLTIKAKDDDIALSVLTTMAESCAHFAVLNTERSAEEEGLSIIIGLSTRSRLYCNEALIFAGVSTFAYNSSLDTLLYITLGTKPMLCFMPGSQLSESLLEKNREGAATYGNNSVGSDSTARPVERFVR